MAAHAIREALDVERCRGDVEPRVERAAIRVLGSILNLYDRRNIFEARLSEIGPVSPDPGDILRGLVDTRLDAAVPLLDGRLGDELVLGAVSK